MRLTRKEVQEGHINHILKNEKEATLTVIGTIKILRYINKNDEPCFRLFLKDIPKPLYAYRFKSVDEREKSILTYSEHLNKISQEKENYKKQKMEERKNFTPSVAKGTVFVSSWGYEQTNVDFYEVLEVKGKTVKLVGIGAERVAGSEGHDCCELRAVPGTPLKNSEPFKKQVLFGDRIKMNSYASAYVWDGKPKYCSWYY